jgi:phosphopantetheinyl transferase (holo-ACP synthase)
MLFVVHTTYTEQRNREPFQLQPHLAERALAVKRHALHLTISARAQQTAAAVAVVT